MTCIALIYLAVLALIVPRPACAQAMKKTLVAVFAHADDEGPVDPIMSSRVWTRVQSMGGSPHSTRSRRSLGNRWFTDRIVAYNP